MMTKEINFGSLNVWVVPSMGLMDALVGAGSLTLRMKSTKNVRESLKISGQK